MSNIPRSTWLALAWSYAVTAATMGYFGWCLGADLGNYFLHWLPALLTAAALAGILAITVKVWLSYVWRLR